MLWRPPDLGVKKGGGFDTAGAIRTAVRRQLELPLSIGISSNKLLAKIACGLAKPDNLQALWPEDVPKHLWPLPVKMLPGVGPATEKKLHSCAVRTIGDMAKYPEESLVRRLGKSGAVLKKFAQGQDDRTVELEQERKSISEEITFPRDIYDQGHVLAVLLELSEEVGYRLRSRGLRAGTISLKLRFADFSTITRDTTLPEGTASDREICRQVEKLFLRHSGSPPWRLVGVKAAGLESTLQLSLFNPVSENERNITLVKDRLRDKYGRAVLVSAKRLRGPGKYHGAIPHLSRSPSSCR